MTERAIFTRLGLGAASLALSALLWLGFRSGDSVAITDANSGAGSTTAGGGSGTTGTGSGGSAGSAPTATSPTGTGSAGTGSTGTGSTGSGATSGGIGGAGGSNVVDGPVIETRFGPVEVEVTVSNGKVTNVTAVELPSGGRSGSISQYAAPILANEAKSAQSASIDIVSGATYTSRAYAQSLQAALDQAGV